MYKPTTVARVKIYDTRQNAIEHFPRSFAHFQRLTIVIYLNRTENTVLDSKRGNEIILKLQIYKTCKSNLRNVLNPRDFPFFLKTFLCFSFIGLTCWGRKMYTASLSIISLSQRTIMPIR